MSLPSSTKFVYSDSTCSSSRIELDSSLSIESTPNTFSIMDEVYDRSGEIEKEFKEIISQGASVKNLRSKVIGALKLLEKVCKKNENLAHENTLNIIRYENIIKEMEEKISSLLKENQELSSALNVKELDEYSTPKSNY